MGQIWPKGGLFWLLGYIFGYVALLVVALALSSALYLVAEYAEEFPTFAGKCVKYCLLVVLSLHLLLWFDGMPWFESLVGIGCNVCYASMLSTFPFVEIFSIRSIASALAFLLAHYVWFSYFLDNSSDIMHVVGFFVVMVWLVPGGLFVSLAINDNVLPGVTGSKGANQIGGERPKGSNLFKTFYDFVQERAGPWMIQTWNSIASRVGGGANRITGGGAYGRAKKKGDDYDGSNSGGGYGGGGGGGYTAGGSGGYPSHGGYGSGAGGYAASASSISAQGQPQYQQQQQYQQQYQQHQQQYQAQTQAQAQYQYQPPQQPEAYTSSMHAASNAGLKRR